jgi:hypothetical protein
MAIDPCALRQITIGTAGLTNLTILGGSSRNWCIRSLENRKRNNERTAYGTPKNLGNRVYNPTLRWTLEDAYVVFTDLTLLEAYIVTHNTNQDTVFTLQDENDRMYTGFGTWHNKTIVPDSTVTDASTGLSRAYYSCNAFLDLTQDKYYEVVGEGLVSLKGWSFMEVATN